MKVAFHYIIKAKLIRFTEGNGIEFSEFQEKFEDDNPIIAREKAFNRYQSFIDVLLENKNKKYLSDRQARIDLNSFIDPGTKTKIKIGEKEVEFSDSFGNGIGIFIVINKTIQNEICEDTNGDEFLIHGIGRIGSFDAPQDLIDGLDQEFLYYEQFDYDTKNYLRIVDFYEYDNPESGPYKILETPFDWTGYDKPYDEQEREIVEEENNELISLEEAINKGESNQVEFKPSLLYNFSSGKAGISM